MINFYEYQSLAIFIFVDNTAPDTLDFFITESPMRKTFWPIGKYCYILLLALIND